MGLTKTTQKLGKLNQIIQNLVTVALNQIWKVIKGNRALWKNYIRQKVLESQKQKKILVLVENLDQTRDIIIRIATVTKFDQNRVRVAYDPG